MASFTILSSNINVVNFENFQYDQLKFNIYPLTPRFSYKTDLTRVRIDDYEDSNHFQAP